MKKTETKHTCCGGRQNFWLWLGALVVGSCLGLLGVEWVNTAANFVATIFTRLFQFIAVPTIALAVTTTLATFGMQRETRRIFRHTISYTLLTTVAAAAVGMVLYIIISPDNLPIDMVRNSTLGDAVPAEVADGSYLKYMIGIVPDNFLRPFIEGNVLSVLLIAVAVGLALAKMPEGDNKQLLMRGISALQDVVSRLIRWLITVLPVGIVAFAAQLSAEVSAGTVVASIGKYVAVILCGNLLQFFVVLPLFLMARGLNPVHVMRRMMPAVLMALFTKSSAATLPVTIQTSEERLGGDVALRDAERRHRTLAARDAALAFHLGCGCHRQCRSADGLLLPHALADVGRRRAGGYHGYYPACLHRARHDRDRRECVVGLVRSGNGG